MKLSIVRYASLLALCAACAAESGDDPLAGSTEQAASGDLPVNLHIGDMSQSEPGKVPTAPFVPSFQRVLQFSWKGSTGALETVHARAGEEITIPCTLDGRITVRYKLRNAFYSSRIPAGTARNFSDFFKIVSQFPVEANSFTAAMPGGIANGTSRVITLADLDVSRLPRDTPLPFSLRLDIVNDVAETNEGDNEFRGGSIRFARCP